jgi:Domain of Unknown Function with PDB structure (DUF3857)
MIRCKKISLVALFATLFTVTTFAQKAPIKFGKIDEADLKMTVYPNDSSASAVILCDYGDAVIAPNIDVYQITYEYHRRVKILKADADVLQFFGNIEVPYYKEEIVSDIKAVSYELVNGVVKETKLDKSSIFKKELFKDYYTKSFALPNIKAGVVIEYTYYVTSPYVYRPETWYFQHPYPTVWSEYRFDRLKLNYRFNQEGFNPLTTNKDLNATTKQWIMKDVPALRNEPYITTPLDYFDKIEFQYAMRAEDEWKQFVKNEMRIGIGNDIKKNDGIGTIVSSLTDNKPNKMDKIAAIVDYLKTNIAIQNGAFLQSDRYFSDVINKKSGTSSEINVILGAMLRQAGFDVTPILMSTRSHGRVAKTYPLLNRFNYLLMSVEIDSNRILLDAVDKTVPLGILPFEALNGEGLLLDVKNPRWISLQATKMVDLMNVDITIENGKILRGSIATTQKSYKGWDSRLKIAKDGEDKHAKAMLEKLVGNGKLTAQKFDNTGNSSEPLKGKFEFETTEFMDVNAERIYLNPMLAFGKTENLLKKADRQFPVDFAHPSDEIYNFSLKVPTGYVVEELPKPVKLAWEDGSISFQYVVAPANAEGVVKITSKLSIKKPVFMASEYADLKKTFDDIVAKHAEQIVLKKAK